MTMDDLTIRIYPDPSHLKFIDNLVYRYYPITGEAVKIPEEHEFYGEMVMALEDEKSPRENPSYVVEINGTFYRYYYDTEGFYDDLDSSLPEKCSSRTATWFELPEAIRHAYVSENYPDATLEEHYILVYGKEKAKKLIEHDQWIESHIVYDEDITCDIEAKIGRFNEVKPLDSGYFFPEHTALDKTKYFRYLLDDRWLVTVIDRHDPFEDIEEEVMFYTPNDHPSHLMLTKINQLSELPWTLLNILDLKPE